MYLNIVINYKFIIGPLCTLPLQLYLSIETTAICPSGTVIGTNTLNLQLESIFDDALFNEVFKHLQTDYLIANALFNLGSIRF